MSTDAVARHAAALLLLALALWLVYGRASGFDYAFMDDVDYVARNSVVSAGLTRDGVAWAFTAFAMGNWHPLTWLSHMLDVELFGVAPGPQHAVNLLLHGIDSALVYWIAWRLLARQAIALFVAAAFLLHPLHVESVAWIAERKDLLSALFYFAAILAWLRYVARPSLARYAVVAAAFVLALLAKPMAISLPLVLMLLDLWPLQRPGAAELLLRPRVVLHPGPARGLLLEKLPLFALCLASAAVTLAAQQVAIATLQEVPVAHRWMNAVLSCVLYLRDMVLPHALAALYPIRPVDPWREFAPALGVFLLACGFAWHSRRSRPWVLVGWLWFLVTLLPVIGIVQVGMQSRADRYMYIPSLGLLLALGASLARLDPRSLRRCAIPLGAWICFLGFMAWIQVGYWADQRAVFQRVLDVSGPVYQAHASLSGYYLDRGDAANAEAHALEAIRLAPGEGLGYAVLGSVYLSRRDYPRAEAALRAAVERAPRQAIPLFNLGIALEGQGRRAEARQYVEAALRLQPTLAGGRALLERMQ